MKALQKLIAGGESDTLDFKKRITNPERIARTLVSFANTRGGILLVGVLDNGTICGADPDEEMHLLEIAATKYCKPPVDMHFETLEDDEGHTVLQVTIPESRQKPHLVKINETDWQSFSRVDDRSVQTKNLKSTTLEVKPGKKLPALSADEIFLLEYLETNQRITLKQFQKLVKIPEKEAWELLIRMALAGFIGVQGKGDQAYYFLP